MPNIANVLAVVFVIVVMLSGIGILLISWALFRPWLKAFLAGKPIHFFNLIGMKLRGSNTKLILDQGIAAQQAGCSIDWIELERAQLQRVDLEKITLAYIASQNRKLGFTFAELVKAEQDGKLENLMR